MWSSTRTRAVYL